MELRQWLEKVDFPSVFREHRLARGLVCFLVDPRAYRYKRRKKHSCHHSEDLPFVVLELYLNAINL